MRGVRVTWNYLGRRVEVLCLVVLYIVVAVAGGVWLTRAFFDDNRGSVCASLANLAADRRSSAVTLAEASFRAHAIFEQAEVGRDGQLTDAVGDYGRALSSGDPVEVERAEVAVEQMCDVRPGR